MVKTVILLALLWISGCDKKECIESEYINCNVNKETFLKIRIGMTTEELDHLLRDKNALKRPALGQGSTLKTWDYGIMWRRCSLHCEDETSNPVILVGIKNKFVISMEYSEN